MRIKAVLLLLAAVSISCSIQLAPARRFVESAQLPNTRILPVSIPTPPTSSATVVGSVRLRSAPDNTGSHTLTVIQDGETFHVQRRTIVLSTEWAYGSWFDGEEWITGYVAARFLR